MKKVKDIGFVDEMSWNDSVYLTFDIDWASDEVLSYTIDLLESYDSQATFFITHDTKLLERIRENPNFELGIHPNFNFLLNGSQEKGANYKEVIERLLDIVPEAKSVRSHSMTQNSHILGAFQELGLTHDSNHFVSVTADIELKPWLLWNGLIRCPYFWEDDVHFTEKDDYTVDQLLLRKGLKIFDFHPIHVFLNTEDATRYEESKFCHGNWTEVQAFKNTGYGTENILIEILEKCR